MVSILAYGGGVNSTAMIVGMIERGERADAVVFADTGGELPEVYTYIETISTFLAAHQWPALTVVRRAHNDAETLEANCLRFGKLPSIAYGFKTCSTEWKKRPSERWARTWPLAVDAWARGEKVVKLLGYDADEPHRFTRIRQEGPYRIECPLIAWDWGRAECVEAVARAGLPAAPKSSCFFCPSRRPANVIALAGSHPDHFARARAIENGAVAEDAKTGKRSEIRGLARRWTWGEIVDGAAAQCALFGETPCDCYDGSDDGAV
jgi:hypothetical protein